MTRSEAGGIDHDSLDPIMLAATAGFLVMFFVERFASFHHHEAPESTCEHGHDHSQEHDHAHKPVGNITWIGAALGLTLHSLLEGVALASSVMAANVLHPGLAAAGFGTFLVILLHKPFDAMTLTTLFSAGAKAGGRVHLLNLLFALVVPVGAGLFMLGVGSADATTVSLALAFSAGTFLCIAGSDLLPELQFHRHDRFALSLMLALGVGVAWGVGRLESRTHGHDHAPAAAHDDHAGHDHTNTETHP
jgi:zinc and cadmium transporter